MAADPPDAKIENGNAASAVVDYTAYPPPPGPSENPATPPAGPGAGPDASGLTPAQAEMHKKVLEHFQNESYRITGVQNGKLQEEEKFWLVRFLFFSCFLVSCFLLLFFFCLVRSENVLEVTD